MSEASWIELGPVEDFPVRGARVVRTDGGDIAVFRTGDDHLFALDNRCPHRGGPLSEGIVYGHRVACPLHDWRIELASGEAVAPDEGCTHTYPVSVSEGRVYLQLPNRVGAHAPSPEEATS
ncbi:MAG: nitrite reductase small subunit NirD [Thiohalorhabdaceae bacterium]